MNPLTRSGAVPTQATLPGVMAIRPTGNLRQLLLVAFAAVTVVAVACGSETGAASSADSAEAQDRNEKSASSSGPILTSTGSAPAFEVSTPNHGVFNLDRLEGQPVLLNFWFPSCPPCRAELPDLQSAYEAHGDEIQFLGVQLLGLDSADEAEEFLRELGVTYPSGPDAESQMVRDFKIVGFPTTVFIDRDHNIVKKHTGILSEDTLASLISSTVALGGSQGISGDVSGS